MDEFVKAAVLENEFEAQVLESIVRERNIPYLLRSYHDTAYDGLFQVQKGWGELFAPSEFEEEILAIIKMIRSEV